MVLNLRNPNMRASPFQLKVVRFELFIAGAPAGWISDVKESRLEGLLVNIAVDVNYCL